MVKRLARQTDLNGPEISSHCHGLAGDEVEKLQPGFVRGPVDIVNPLFQHHEGAHDDTLRRPSAEAAVAEEIVRQVLATPSSSLHGTLRN